VTIPNAVSNQTVHQTNADIIVLTESTSTLYLLYLLF
jgi:hypothetical protein